MLDEIIKSNSKLSKYPSIVPDLRRIEAFIPSEVRENFYRNLKTLRIEETNKIDIARYLCSKNIIEINSNNKDSKTISYELCHELIHMASNKYDPFVGCVMTGFSFVLGINRKIRSDNVYLNEGFTESFNLLFYPEFLGCSGYNEEVAITTILSNLFGVDNIKIHFFNSSLINPLKFTLTKFLDEESVDVFLSLVEANYICKKNNDLINKQDFLKEICQILLELIDKCKVYYLNNGLTNESIENYLDLYVKGNMYFLISLLPEYEQDFLREKIDYTINQLESNQYRGFINLYYCLIIILIISLGVVFAWFML